jgi:hypothetical protein
MKLAARLPLLPDVRERDGPRRLARRQERPMEGPQEGGTSHLRDEVHVDDRTIDGDGPLFANF